ncbi:MAG: AbrB/MazE/SpoVT family DNA-binding domain-containing protein [Clostridiales bacterium]
MASPKGKYAWTVKVGEKGQFVIPKEAREIFNIEPGDTLIILADEKQGIAIPPPDMFAQLAKAIFPENRSSAKGGKEEEE